MAPIPEKNQDKPTDINNDESDINSFSNANLVYYGVSGSSEDEEIYENSALEGYTLLSQDPDDENEDENTNVDCADIARENEASASYIDDSLPEAALDFDMCASAPSVTLSNDSCHPGFLAKFVDGKIPSYLQVSASSKDRERHLWNQKAQDPSNISLDSAQESKILGAMSGFSLPLESIPDWAKNLTDDQWHFQILKHIGVTKSSKKDISEEPSSSTPWEPSSRQPWVPSSCTPWVPSSSTPWVPSSSTPWVPSSSTPWVAEFLETDKDNSMK